jgi:polyisoprenoid-binding protein YceI
MTIRRYLLLGVFVWLSHGAHDSPAQEAYEIDNTHSFIIFAVKHFDIGYAYGRFNQCSGEFTLDDTTPANNSFSLKIDAKSVDTNSADRDKHLRGPDFFDVEQFPEITFTSTAVEKTEDGLKVTGNMTLHGQTKEMTMPLTLVGRGKNPFGKTCAGFLTKFRLKRSEFGMDAMLPGVGDDIAITFAFEGIKKE